MITIGLHPPACGALFDAKVERLDYPPLFCTFCSSRLEEAAPEGWTHVATAQDAIILLAGGRVIELSLDHDLGDEEANGRGTGVVDYIVEQQEVHGRDLWPAHGIHLHTGNAYGRDAMARTIRRYAAKLCFVTETWAGGQPHFHFERRDPRGQGEC